MDFERLPDEILLEICRYLSCTDILYSLFDLNIRLNCTITFFCKHVILRQTSFSQFEYICSNILPRIGPKICSLSVNANWTDLLAKRFHFHFGHRFNEIFPNIEHLIFVAFSGNELNDYLESLFNLRYLTKLSIYDRYNITDEYKQILFDKILSANENRLERICLNRHSESLSINPTNSKIYSNIIELNIHLENKTDLRQLFQLIPNIHQLIIFLNQDLNKYEELEFENLIMKNLIEFSLESSGRLWSFKELRSLLNQMPFLQDLHLDLISRDYRLINGQQILSLLSSLNTLQNFNYVNKYRSTNQIQSLDEILLSWSSTPYSIVCLLEDNRHYLFLHTIPYRFTYLDMNSVFYRQMKTNTEIYRFHIKELSLFNASNITETFLSISNCLKIQDLFIGISDQPLENKVKEEKKQIICLPYLNKLRWLSIAGCPSDGYQIKEILTVARNLWMLIIDLKYLLQLIDRTDDLSWLVLLRNRMRYLFIRISDQTDINEKNLEKISNIFLDIRHLIIESKITDVSIENLVLFVLNSFQNHSLISIIIRGSISEQIRTNPSQWLIQSTYLKDNSKFFQIDCDQTEFRIWF